MVGISGHFLAVAHSAQTWQQICDCKDPGMTPSVGTNRTNSCLRISLVISQWWDDVSLLTTGTSVI
jgi:hypothetical protein